MKSSVYAAAALSSTLLIAGCGSTEWQKPDGTDAQRHGDQAECQVMANQADDSQTFEDCMKGRGWVEE